MIIFKSNPYTRIYSYVFVTIISFLFFANITYYQASGTMLHLGMLKFLGEAKAIFDISYIKIVDVLIFLGMILLFVALNEIYTRVFKTDKIKRNKYYAISLLSVLFIFVLSAGLTSTIYKKIYDDSEKIVKEANIKDGKTVINFYTKYLKKSSFDSFGVLTFYISDFSINFLNADCGKEINKVKEDITDQNDFTGILEGYNIFTIMIETGIYDLIQEKYTPNLYNLMHNGLNFTNNYSKNKTSVSEIIAFTGSYPVDGINYQYDTKMENCVYNLKINTPYSLPNMLGDTYHKQFFHDGEGLYARNSLIGQFGFDTWKHEFYDVHPYKTPGWDFIGNYELDSDYVDIVLDDMYSKDKPFYTHYSTLSTHGPYEEYSGETAVRERMELFEELGYVERFEKYYDEMYYPLYGDLDGKAYTYLKHITCAAMNLDDAVGKIINRLKEEGLFDKTLFVVYGDHDCYYHQSSTNPSLSRLLTGSKKESDVEQYHTTMFMYNETLTDKYREVHNLDDSEPCEVKIFTSPYIIVPTVLDLFGIEYESEYYYSLSFFDFSSIYDGLFYSNELSAFFMNNMYSIIPGSFIYIDDMLTNEDVEKIEEIEKTKLLKLKTINDYYKEWFYFENKK